MGAIIEAATTSDRPAIFALLTKNNLPVDGLTDHIDTTIIARLDGLVVGCAALELYLDGALLRSGCRRCRVQERRNRAAADRVGVDNGSTLRRTGRVPPDDDRRKFLPAIRIQPS